MVDLCGDFDVMKFYKMIYFQFRISFHKTLEKEILKTYCSYIFCFSIFQILAAIEKKIQFCQNFISNWNLVEIETKNTLFSNFFFSPQQNRWQNLISFCWALDTLFFYITLRIYIYIYIFYQILIFFHFGMNLNWNYYCHSNRCILVLQIIN